MAMLKKNIIIMLDKYRLNLITGNKSEWFKIRRFNILCSRHDK